MPHFTVKGKNPLTKGEPYPIYFEVQGLSAKQLLTFHKIYHGHYKGSMIESAPCGKTLGTAVAWFQTHADVPQFIEWLAVENITPDQPRALNQELARIEKREAANQR